MGSSENSQSTLVADNPSKRSGRRFVPNRAIHRDGTTVLALVTYATMPDRNVVEVAA
jgi:hypothetical protein